MLLGVICRSATDPGRPFTAGFGVGASRASGTRCLRPSWKKPSGGVIWTGICTTSIARSSGPTSTPLAPEKGGSRPRQQGAVRPQPRRLFHQAAHAGRRQGAAAEIPSDTRSEPRPEGFCSFDSSVPGSGVTRGDQPRRSRG